MEASAPPGARTTRCPSRKRRGAQALAVVALAGGVLWGSGGSSGGEYAYQVRRKPLGGNASLPEPPAEGALPEPSETLTPQQPTSSPATSVAATMLPLQAFQSWQAQHSVAALRQETSQRQRKDRKFLLARYACPRQAGSLLHGVTTALLLAMVTNRTLLWQYDARLHPALTRDNVRPNCDAVLRMADWIPAYDDWQAVYHLAAPLTVTGVEQGGWNLTQLHARYQASALRLVPEHLAELHRTAPLLRAGKRRGLTPDYELWSGLFFSQSPFPMRL